MRRALNWQLILGLALIVAWLVIGFGAPFFTGVDPLKERTFVQVGTHSIPAPFEPGMYGYPLGSDRQGRDHALRPRRLPGHHDGIHRN